MKTRGAGEHMRKIKKALFQENAASVFLFETGIIIITVAVLLIWRSDLFGYFFWQDKIRSGHYLYWVYLAVALPGYFADMWCRNETFFRMAVIGLTPAAVVLFIRWLLSGFISAAILLLLVSAYCMIIFFQALWGALKKKKAKYFSLGINHISCALSAAALLGTAGYCLTGMDTVDAGIAGKVVTAEDGRAWDENREMLRQWKEDVYEELPDRDRQELFQALINLECGYWGIDPIPLEIETYESDTLMGYYVDEYYVISIRKEMFDMPREEVMGTLLHEVHHAYVHKAVESVDWDSEKIKENAGLRIYADLKSYKEGIENYVQAREDYDSYYQNPIEVAAREYAEEWTYRYLEYIDNI